MYESSWAIFKDTAAGVSGVAGIPAAMLTGAILGVVGGPVGMPIGAFIGGVVGVVAAGVGGGTVIISSINDIKQEALKYEYNKKEPNLVQRSKIEQKKSAMEKEQKELKIQKELVNKLQLMESDKQDALKELQRAIQAEKQCLEVFNTATTPQKEMVKKKLIEAQQNILSARQKIEANSKIVKQLEYHSDNEAESDSEQEGDNEQELMRQNVGSQFLANEGELPVHIHALQENTTIKYDTNEPDSMLITGENELVDTVSG